MRAVDRINARMDSDTVRYAALGDHPYWQMRRNYHSPAYATSWKDLPQVQSVSSDNNSFPSRCGSSPFAATSEISS